MTTTTVFASASDGVLFKSSTVYATAAAGPAASVTSTGTAGEVGQIFSTPNYSIWQLFFEFDTSGIAPTGTISDAVLSLDGSTDVSTTDFVMTALGYDWSAGGLTTADWRTPTELSALTTLATFNSSGYSAGYMDFTSSGAALKDYINKTGSTYFIVASSRNISATVPTGNERVDVAMSEAAGTTTDPKLFVTYTPGAGEFTWTSLGTNNVTTAAASLALASVTAAVGSLLYIVVSADNSGTNGAACTTTCADDSAEAGTANTWTQQTQVNNDPGAASAGVTLTIFTSILTRALVADTITVSFSPSTVAAITGEKGVFESGGLASVITAGAGATGASSNSTITSGSITSGDIIIGATAIEYNSTITEDTDTTNGSWSAQIGATANTGTAATSTQIVAQRKWVNATATQSYDTAFAGTRDWATNYIVVRGEALPAVFLARLPFIVSQQSLDRASSW